MKKTISIIVALQEALPWLIIWRIFEYVGIVMIPTIFILVGIIPKEDRIITLVCVFIYSLAVARKRNWLTAETYGLKRETFKFDYWFQYGLWTILAAAGLYGFANIISLKDPHWTRFEMELLVGISLLLSVIQESVFRPFLFRVMKDITDKSSWIVLLNLLNVLMFVCIHTIYINIGFSQLVYIVPITTVGGILFTFLYKRFQNFVLVSLMHFVLNYEALRLGFFPVQTIKTLEDILKSVHVM